MVLTKKFSQFTDSGDLENDDITVGFGDDGNVFFNNPWTFLPPGNTGERPPVEPSMYYRLRFNTQTIAYEFYDQLSEEWVQLGDTVSILSLLASHSPGEGASLIGLEDQSTVTSKTVQDLANATIVAQTNNGTLENAQFLDVLSTGFVSVTTATGVLASRTIGGTTNEIDVTNSNGAGNSVHSLSSTLDFPGTFTVQGTFPISAIINDSTMATASTTNLSTSAAIKTYVDTTAGGTVASVSGTANRITSTGGNNPVIDISASYVGQSSITTLGTIATGTWQGGVIGGTYGGTGVNNGASTITLGGSLTTSGAFATIFTIMGATNVTFPTTGTLATTAGTVSSVSGTAGRITSTGGTTPVIDIDATYVGQSSITTVGTIASGTWQGTVIGSTYGGTGVNNGSSTLTLAGNLATSGAFASTFTMTGATSVTFPTSGTLATVGQTDTFVAIAGTTQAGVEDTSYWAQNAGTTTLTIPATFTAGKTIRLQGYGGAWVVQMNTGQTAHFESAVTTSAGTISSNNQYDGVTLLCTVANTTFVVCSNIGVLTLA